MYELGLRVREGLPLPALQVIGLIIESAIARAQRDSKVILCDWLWMGNHVHMLLVSLCPESCTRFYQEVQKKVCESLKRLLGLERLSMWEGDAMLAEILDVEGAVRRKAYIYANPARAGLTDTVSDYPGVSTWREFESCASSGVNVSVSREVPWIRLPMIRQAPGRSLSERQDRFISSEILSKSRRRHRLEIHPNAWMKAFRIDSDKEAAEINEKIKQRVCILEEEARRLRLAEGKGLLGKERLRRQAILRPHTPKKRQRRAFVLSSSTELRTAYIRMHDEVCALCAECYKRWKLGDFRVEWPPGTFPPSPGVRASAIVTA